MKRRIYFLTVLVSAFFFLTSAYAELQSAGIVNFNTCVLESKQGQHRTSLFQDAENRMKAIITDLEKQVQTTANKLEDAEYIDSLSPEAEEELRSQHRMQSEELMRSQHQYYQDMNQAKMQLLNSIRACVQQACEPIAKKQKLSVIIQRDSCFYYEPSQDITAEVIAEMDKNFERENEAQQAKTADQNLST